MTTSHKRSQPEERLEYMGVSQWRKYGEDHGYWGYFRAQVLKEKQPSRFMKNLAFFLAGVLLAFWLAAVLN